MKDAADYLVYINPHAQMVRHSQYQPTLVRRGAAIGRAMPY